VIFEESIGGNKCYVIHKKWLATMDSVVFTGHIDISGLLFFVLFDFTLFLSCISIGCLSGKA
jgi:hypothetical protein